MKQDIEKDMKGLTEQRWIPTCEVERKILNEFKKYLTEVAASDYTDHDFLKLQTAIYECGNIVQKIFKNEN